MSVSKGYLLDTNIVLHLTRANSPVAVAVEQQFQLASSPFRPLICEVTIAEMWAFAMSSSWSDKRKEILKRILEDLLVVPISDRRIHQRWAEVRSHARSEGLAIQHDHNDIWIAATAHVAGVPLLSSDVAAFKPLRGTPWADVHVLDPKTGIIVP